jgi:hypothetical protein
MTELELTIAVLEQLKQPYEIWENSNLLIITPTSSPMLECLPGDWIPMEDNSTQLYISLDKGPFIDPEYIAKFIMKVASRI